jgi:amino acid adenylation domain-containing protein
MDVRTDSGPWRRRLRKASATVSRAWRFAARSRTAAPFVETDLCAAAGRDAVAGPESRDNIEDAYPLSPLQHAMLMQSLEALRFGVDVEQILCELREDLDLEAFRRAWRRAVERNPVLRTVFQWEREGGPRQVVLRRAAIPWAEADWRSLSAPDRKRHFEAFLRADRERGFDLATAPAMRFAVIREGRQLYRLCWTLHHLIVDGRQLVLLFNEVFSDYEALRRGEDSAVVALPAYRRHIDWLQQRDWSDAKLYWQRILKGFDTPTRLIFSHSPPRALAPAQMRGEQEVTLSAEVTAKLKAWATANKLTPNILVQGAWALLLARYGGQQDVVFGAIRAGRRRTIPAADRIVGPCINTVPVRVHVRPELTLLAWLKQVRDQWLALRKYEHTPATVAHECSDVPRDQALFQSILNFQDPSWNAALQSQGGEWQRRSFSLVSQPGVPLALDGYGGERFRFVLLYDRRLFEDAAILRMLGHLQTLLDAMAADPQQRLSALPLLTDAERQQVLVSFNETKRAYPRHESVHRLFEAQARSTPDATALLFEGQTLSYQALNRKANQVARFLRRRGVGRGAFVGICVERSLEMVVAMLGILKAGGAYVALDPAYPRERLAFLLADIRPPLVLTQKGLAARLPETESEIVCLDDDRSAIPHESIDSLDGDIGADDLAYVIYTSGSTGVPKGACIPHRGIVRLVKNTNYVTLDADEVVLQFAPISFDASTFEIWGALLNGGRLVIFPPNRPSLEQLGDAIRDHGITTLWLTAALFQHMVEQCLESLRGVRQLLAGGDVLSVAAARKVLQELPACRLINGYGPTENTTFTCCHSVTALSDGCSSIPIGRPVANTTAYVLDPELRPVPVGVPGALWTGGDGIALNYLNHPKLTAERFLPDPFSKQPGARMYHTGDRVRWLPDGTLEFLGRLDQQMKIRGFRVEPGEIEAVLATYQSVGEAVVVARGDTPAERRLVAYATPRKDSGLAADDLMRFLRQKLPDYMVPAAVVLMPALPLNANGKVDRQALPDLEHDRQQAHYLAPRTITEEITAAIWADVLKLEAVGVQGHFFELGGDSLSAMSTVARLRRAFQVDVPVSLLFEQPVLANLSDHIDRLRAGVRSIERPPVRAVPRDRPLPLSFYQERVWRHCQAASDPMQFRTQINVKLRGPLHIAAFEQTFAELFRRHEPLRTTFETREGKPVQIIGPVPPMTLRMIDLHGRPDVDDILERHVRDDAQCPFDLARGPLLRATLLRLDDQNHRLVLSIHHLIYDGSIREILFREMSVLYDAFCRDEPSPLPKLAVQYGDFAAWQQRWLSADSNLFQRQLAYWQNQLKDVPHLRLPFERTGSLEKTGSASYDVGEAYQRTSSLPEGCIGRLDALARREGVTAFMIALAAFKALLYRCTGQEDILVGTYVVDRTHPELEGVVGLKANQLALRTRLSGNPTFQELLRRVRQTMMEAYAHQDIPFTELIETFQARGQSPPSIEAIIDFVRMPKPWVSFSGLSSELAVSSVKTKPWGFTVIISQRSDEHMRVGTGFDIDRYDPDRVRQILAAYADLLQQAIDSPELRLSNLRVSFDQAAEIVDLADKPTPSAHRDSTGAEGMSTLPPAIPRASRDRPVPLSLFQEWIWDNCRRAGPSAAFRGLLWFRIKGPLDIQSLERSLQELLRRHEILRTTLVETAQGTMQMVGSPEAVPMAVIDLSGHVDINAAMARVMDDEARRLIDLTREPPLRATLIRRGAESHRLLLAVHHIAYDSNLSDVFFREWGALYDAFRRGERSPLAEPSLQYADFVIWQRRLLENVESVSEHVDYWKKQLADAPPLPQLPWRRVTEPAEPPDVQSSRRTLMLLLPDRLEQLKALARRAGSTPYMILLAAFQALLCRMTGQNDLIVGSYFAYRNQPEFEGVLGFRTNLVLLRTNLTGDPTFLELLQRVRAANLAAAAHQDVPFTELSRALDGAGSAIPPVQVMFQHTKFNRWPLSLAGARVGRLQVARLAMPSGFSLTVAERTRQRMMVIASFDANLYEPARVGGMLEEFRALLERILDGPTRRLSELLAADPRDGRSATQVRQSDGSGRRALPGVEGAQFGL